MYESYDHDDIRFLTAAHEELGNHFSTVQDSWYYPYRTQVGIQLPGIETTSSNKDVDIYLGRVEDDGVIYKASWFSNRTVRVEAAARESAEAVRFVNHLKTLFPTPERVDPNELGVNFWSRAQNGRVDCYRRDLVVPAWSEVRDNYPQIVRERLDFLMKDYKARPEGGKLLLWTGEPGTGKTYALRALGREWADWCEFHYVTDPDVFFSSPVDYLFQVALDADGNEDKKWRLVVCEDTGELLSADAKSRTGTGLARFLNVCDGIIGQGMRIQVLITTNEDIGRFHEAVTRPGRAAHQIRFAKFQANEKWHDLTVERPATLAELYAIEREEDTTAVDSHATAGFAAL